MKGPIAWFARNGVVANLLLLVIVASGLYALANLKREVYAEFALDVITVAGEFRGAGPEHVEEAICIRLEEAVQGVEGIQRITSTATEGSGSMALALQSGYDVHKLLEDVKTKVDAIDTFPGDVDKPVIQEMIRRFQVINLSIAGETALVTLKRLGARVRDELTALPEISQAELWSALPYEISIEVSEDALSRWRLTFDDVAEAVRRFSVDLPGGSIKTDVREVLLRTKGQAHSGDQHESFPLLVRPGGTKVYLRDVRQSRCNSPTWRLPPFWKRPS